MIHLRSRQRRRVQRARVNNDAILFKVIEDQIAATIAIPVGVGLRHDAWPPVALDVAVDIRCRTLDGVQHSRRTGKLRHEDVFRDEFVEACAHECRDERHVVRRTGVVPAALTGFGCPRSQLGHASIFHQTRGHHVL